ncbi:MAG: hypothetical protein CBB97_23745 [Candidatus Endolissoclinum sp. TMED37]|nr:MAG: hypothetical protein CBB97_23745 [Candidatus Endolissoclinum sp. TMED37]
MAENNDIIYSNILTIKHNLQFILNNISKYEPLYHYLISKAKQKSLNDVYFQLQKLNNYNNITFENLNNLVLQLSGLIDVIMLYSKKNIDNKLYIIIDMNLICLVNYITLDIDYDDTKEWYNYEIKNNYVQYFIYENIEKLPTIDDLNISQNEEIIIIIDQIRYDNILEINIGVNTNIRRYYLVKQIDENNLQFQIFYPYFSYRDNYKITKSLLNDIIHKKFTIIK